jgi:hypothetical protein
MIKFALKFTLILAMARFFLACASVDTSEKLPDREPCFWDGEQQQCETLPADGLSVHYEKITPRSPAALESVEFQK